ncbi:hypothetical protein D3C83_304170 [compost metagenome]
MKPCDLRLVAMSRTTASSVSGRSLMLPGVRTSSGLPESSMMIGASRVLPRVRAMRSPVTLRT